MGVSDRAETIEELDRRARELQAEDRWDAEAEDVNHRILELKRGHPAASIRLGRCFEASGRFQEALDLYRWTGEHADSSVARARAARLEQDMARAVKEGTGTAAKAPPKSGGRAPTLPPRELKPDEAATIVERSIPDGPGGEAALAFVRATIELAESINAENLFALPLEQGRTFRLMGGRVSLIRAGRGGFHAEVDTRALPAGVLDELEAAGCLDRHAVLSDIPTAVAALVPFDDLPAWAPKIRDAHDAYVREAMLTPLGGHHSKHQVALLDALRAQGTP